MRSQSISPNLNVSRACMHACMHVCMREVCAVVRSSNFTTWLSCDRRTSSLPPLESTVLRVRVACIDIVRTSPEGRLSQVSIYGAATQPSTVDARYGTNRARGQAAFFFILVEQMSHLRYATRAVTSCQKSSQWNVTPPLVLFRVAAVRKLSSATCLSWFLC